MHGPSAGTRWKRRARSACLIAASSVLLVGCATPGRAAPDTQWSRIEQDPGFTGWHAELQHMADAFGRARVNHFCVVVRQQRIAGVPQRDALVHWQEQHQIQGFGAAPAGQAIDDTSMAGGDAIDLRHDVVASEAQIDGSTSRVTRVYVDDVLRSCRLHGSQVTIIRQEKHP